MNRPPNHTYPPATAIFALIAWCALGLILLITALNAYAETQP